MPFEVKITTKQGGFVGYVHGATKIEIEQMVGGVASGCWHLYRGSEYVAGFHGKYRLNGKTVDEFGAEVMPPSIPIHEEEKETV